MVFKKGNKIGPRFQKGHKINLGRRWNQSEGAKEKIRNSKLGKKRKPFTKQTKINMSLCKLGIKNPNWCGGKSFEPYSSRFNKRLKELIRERDDYFCQICGKFLLKKGIVHHINYNKKDCRPENLILLCNSCHSKTNFKRNKWRDFFKCLNR